jgi:hypothetical protein
MICETADEAAALGGAGVSSGFSPPAKATVRVENVTIPTTTAIDDALCFRDRGIIAHPGVLQQGSSAQLAIG